VLVAHQPEQEVARRDLRAGHGVGLGDRDVELRLENPSYYAPIEHLCQYRESHLDFVARRLEAEGLYYHFEHAEGGDAELLVISDSRSFLTPLSQEGVRFTPVGDDDTSTVEGLRTFEYECSARPDGARTRGSDYLSPGLDVAGASLRGESPFVVRELESSRAPRDAARHARVMAEQQAAREAVVRGEGRSYELCAGYSFDFEDHPLLAGEYLATAVTVEGFDLAGHRDLAARLGFRGEVFHASVEAIPAAVQFRPERVTPVPVVHGHELGVVRGAARGSEAGLYAHLDQHGRYLVRLRFDDHDAKDTPSARMRMAQSHAGANGAGLHMPLRDGAEVLVGFLRGDPDLPYVAAAVPDAHTPSPVTRENATKNVLQTGGGNRITMEDQQGAEYIKLATPYNNTVFHIGAPHNPQHDFELVTSGSGLVRTGKSGATTDLVKTRSATSSDGLDVGAHGLGIQVAGRKVETVDLDVTETYGTVGRIGQTLTTTVHGDTREDWNGNVTVRIEGNETRTVAHRLTQSIGPSERLDKGTVVHKVDVYGKREETIHGEDEELHKGHSKETFHGIREEYFMGLHNEASLMAKFEFALAMVSSVSVGAALGVNVGPHFDFDFGLRYQLSHGMTATVDKSISFKESVSSIWHNKLSLKKALLTVFV